MFLLSLMEASQVTYGKQYTCQCRRCKKYRLDLWVGKILWSRKWQPTSAFLPGKFPMDRGDWWIVFSCCFQHIMYSLVVVDRAASMREEFVLSKNTCYMLFVEKICFSFKIIVVSSISFLSRLCSDSMENITSHRNLNPTGYAGS